MSKKYGKPQKEDAIWSIDLYKKDPKSIGIAIGMGHVKLINDWDTPETVIIHSLQGDNLEYKHEIVYTSKKYAPATPSQEQEVLSNL